MEEKLGIPWIIVLALGVSILLTAAFGVPGVWFLLNGQKVGWPLLALGIFFLGCVIFNTFQLGKNWPKKQPFDDGDY